MDPSRPHQRRLHAVAAHVATASATEQRPQRALEGVRVLEMATVIAGPMSAAVLGDLGATVIKLESPEGDTGRSRQGPGVSGGATFEK
jgi:crotonobetainyl-CoA:carnitine CoA-transferase CaiB-like acyl-CoA transferase